MVMTRMTEPRELNEQDHRRMGIPTRYRTATLDHVSVAVRPLVERYLSKLPEMRERGIGLLLNGANGVGKTCIGCLILMAYRERGCSALFMPASIMKSAYQDRTFFDEGMTLWERAMSVEVLMVDDLGKGVDDTTGFGARLFDDLLRGRDSNKLVTIVTTNMSRLQLSGDTTVEGFLKQSTAHTLKECLYPLPVTGRDQREDSLKEMNELMGG